MASTLALADPCRVSRTRYALRCAGAGGGMTANKPIAQQRVPLLFASAAHDSDSPADQNRLYCAAPTRDRHGHQAASRRRTRLGYRHRPEHPGTSDNVLRPEQLGSRLSSHTLGSRGQVLVLGEPVTVADRTRIFDGVGPVRLELIGSTTFPSGVLRLAYRPAPNEQDEPSASQ